MYLFCFIRGWTGFLFASVESLMLPLRSYAYRIISRTERLLVLPPSIKLHSATQHSPPLPPPCSDNLLNHNPRTPCLVHLVMLVPAVRLRGVPLAGWVKHRRNRRGDLVRSTRLSSRLSSRRRAASDPSTRLSNLNLNLRILACSGAAVHSRPKTNRWAASVCLLISLRIVDLPYHRQCRRLWDEFQHWFCWSFWTDQYYSTTTTCFY